MKRFEHLYSKVSLLVLATSTCLAAHAIASGVAFNIPSGSAQATLKQFASESHLQVVFDYRAVQKLRTPEVKGTLEPTEALKQLLTGSGLTFYEVNDHTIAIVAPGAAGSSLDTQVKSLNPGADDSSAGGDPNGSSKSHSAALLAQATSGRDPLSSSVTGSADSSSDQGLHEIIVTAQKRAERLQDVPVPVTAINASDLVASNQLSLTDYYNTVPGLSMVAGGGPYWTLSIRGLATGTAQNPTVGITVDDVPYGSSTYLGGGPVVPDLDPSDLQRIEVLRGPQGTLYGASSIGGLIKYVTVDPATESLSGRVEATGDGVQGALGYGFRGAANVPLSDSMAMRVSAFVRRDAGYIADPVTHADNINPSDVYGGHLSFLWRPLDTLSIKASALFQDFKQLGSNDVDLQLGDLQQAYIPGYPSWETKSQAYSLTLKAELGRSELTVLSGFNVSHFINRTDDTAQLGILLGLVPYFPAEFSGTATGLGGYNNTSNQKFSQEVRLSAPITSSLDLLVGGFYTHESAPSTLSFSAESATGGLVGDFGGYTNPTTYEEYAAFADLTYRISDQIDVQFGGREGRIHQTNQATDFGFPFDAGLLGKDVASIPGPSFDSSSSTFTYLVTPRWKITPDAMLYARLASGYQAGGVNTTPGVQPGYAPSKTKNYEIGFKGDALDHILSFDASVYYIDWIDLQLLICPPQHLCFNGNAGGAKSEGVELSLEAHPLAGLTVSSWVTYSDAAITAFPSDAIRGGVYASPGDRLPFTPRWSANLSAVDEFPISGSFTGFAGGTMSYVGARDGGFTGTVTQLRQLYRSYSELNARIGVKRDSWTATLFATNVTDQRGELGGNQLTPNAPDIVQIIRPRQIGLSLSKSF